MKRFKLDSLHKYAREVWRNRTNQKLCMTILDKMREIAPQHPLADAMQCSYSVYCIDVPHKGDYEAYRFAMKHRRVYLAYCVRRNFYGNARKNEAGNDRTCEMKVKYLWKEQNGKWKNGKGKMMYKNGHRRTWH